MQGDLLPKGSKSQHKEKKASLPYVNPEDHYHISLSTREGIGLDDWLAETQAKHGIEVSCRFYQEFGLIFSMQNVYERLLDHLLARLQGKAYDGDEHSFSDEERDNVKFKTECIWRHKVLRLNYTTYDLRRKQDSLHPERQANIMIRAHEDETEGAAWHPYWYARILGVYHAVVQHHDDPTGFHQMDFLWVQWYGRETSSPSGWSAKRLPRIGPLSSDYDGVYGFLDPQEVICGVHLIPAFAHSSVYPPLSGVDARNPEEGHWDLYYLNM